MSTMMQRIGVLVGVAAIAFGCSDSPLVPVVHDTPLAPPSLSKGATVRERVPVLERTRTLRGVHAATVVVGPQGGQIALPGAGFLMRIPAGAVETETAISVTAFDGKAVAYEFAPHGLQFREPVLIEQTLANTTAERDARIRSLLLAGYYEGGTSSIDDNTGTAIISERMPARVSNDAMSVRFEIAHFSGYIIATGRSDMTDSTKTLR